MYFVQLFNNDPKNIRCTIQKLDKLYITYTIIDKIAKAKFNSKFHGWLAFKFIYY